MRQHFDRLLCGSCRWIFYETSSWDLCVAISRMADYGPYSTREMHKMVQYGINRKDGARTVDKQVFISVGSKEKPEPYKGGKVQLLFIHDAKMSRSFRVRLRLNFLCLPSVHRSSSPIAGSTSSGSRRAVRKTRGLASSDSPLQRAPRKTRRTKRSNIPVGRRT